jgi:hypothetical protein
MLQIRPVSVRHHRCRPLDSGLRQNCVSAVSGAMTCAGPACAERAAFLAIGYAKPWRECLSEALKHMWETAKAKRDAILADRTPRASLSAAEARRRELDLLPYREDYRAAQARAREIGGELACHAN